MSKEPADKMKMIVHFVFGFVLGAVAGFAKWLCWSEIHTWSGAIMWIGGGALILGCVAAYLDDSFWENIKDWFV
jgi:peptidoglycan/LPS O-acetylase OafA/YrhL